MPAAKRSLSIVLPGIADTDAIVVPAYRRACSRRRLVRGESLCTAGDSFRALHIVSTGALKCFVTSHNGAVQITGFPIAGDIVGLDGIDTGLHQSGAVALADAEVFVLPFAQCERWSQESAYGQHLLMRTLALETIRSQRHMLALGMMRADQRMALFLLDFSLRYERLGLSRSTFVLGMPRQDIGSYLGLTLETVSRLLSRLQREGLLQVQGRFIDLLDFPALRRLAGERAQRERTALVPIVDGMGRLAVAPR
jgi:CRP/FNR family transcriptional regulator